MSLPLKAVDRLFEHLGLIYGAAWDRSLGSAPLADVKASWAHELSGFADKMELLAWALENLPEPVPNAIMFRNLARRAPAPDVPRLPEPKPDPVRMAAELAKLGQASVATKVGAAGVDHKAWAKRIMAKVDSGLRVNPTTERFAREALANA